jgi:hypothetical protein
VVLTHFHSDIMLLCMTTYVYLNIEISPSNGLVICSFWSLRKSNPLWVNALPHPSKITPPTGANCWAGLMGYTCQCCVFSATEIDYCRCVPGFLFFIYIFFLFFIPYPLSRLLSLTGGGVVPSFSSFIK